MNQNIMQGRFRNPNKFIRRKQIQESTTEIGLTDSINWNDLKYNTRPRGLPQELFSKIFSLYLLFSVFSRPTKGWNMIYIEPEMGARRAGITGHNIPHDDSCRESTSQRTRPNNHPESILRAKEKTPGLPLFWNLVPSRPFLPFSPQEGAQG